MTRVYGRDNLDLPVFLDMPLVSGLGLEGGLGLISITLCILERSWGSVYVSFCGHFRVVDFVLVVVAILRIEITSIRRVFRRGYFCFLGDSGNFCFCLLDKYFRQALLIDFLLF